MYSEYIQKAYREGSDALGFDILTILDDSEFGIIDKQYIERLLEFVNKEQLEEIFCLEADNSYGACYGEIHEEVDLRPHVYMLVASIGDDSLEYSLEENYTETIDIGGYDLLSD